MTFINHPLVGIMFALDKELRRYLDRNTRLAVHQIAGLEIIEGHIAATVSC